MKKMQCEVCGSNEIRKVSDDIFECHIAQRELILFIVPIHLLNVENYLEFFSRSIRNHKEIVN